MSSLPRGTAAVLQLLIEDMGLSYDDARRACNAAGNLLRTQLREMEDATHA